MKISNGIIGLSPLSQISQIRLDPANALTPEVLSPFATTARNKLEEELKKIDGQFDLYGKNVYDLPKSVGYEELSYTPLTDDEIRQYAAAALAEYKLAGAKQIKDSAERNAADLAASKSGLETAAQKKQQEIDAVYDSAKQSSSNDALKRGLARSSIIINKLGALENGKAQAKTDTAQSLFDGIAEIDGKLNRLETEKLDALDEFDIVYAAKLSQEIQKLNEERQKRMDDVIKYNNELKAAEAKYGLDYAKTDSALDQDAYSRNAEIAEKDLLSKMQQSVYEQKYGVVSEYLYNMKPADAVKDLEDNKSFYLEQLGKGGYEKALLEQRSRK